jgi:hypothetical protein
MRTLRIVVLVFLVAFLGTAPRLEATGPYVDPYGAGPLFDPFGVGPIFDPFGVGPIYAPYAVGPIFDLYGALGS